MNRVEKFTSFVRKEGGRARISVPAKWHNILPVSSRKENIIVPVHITVEWEDDTEEVEPIVRTSSFEEEIEEY